MGADPVERGDDEEIAEALMVIEYDEPQPSPDLSDVPDFDDDTTTPMERPLPPRQPSPEASGEAVERLGAVLEALENWDMLWIGPNADPDTPTFVADAPWARGLIADGKTQLDALRAQLARREQELDQTRRVNANLGAQLARYENALREIARFDSGAGVARNLRRVAFGALEGQSNG